MYWVGCAIGLAMVGIFLVRIPTSPPYLGQFNWRELLIMVVWGQAQELTVELLATGAGTWSYTQKW